MIANDFQAMFNSFSAVLACSTTYAYGVHNGIVSSVILFLPQTFPELQASPFLSAVLVASHLVGALFGSFLFSRISDWLGRRIAMALIHTVMLLTSIILPFSTSVAMIIALRLIVGLALGGGTTVVPMYISEIAPDTIRGKVGSFIQFSITFGNISAYIIGYFCASYQGFAPWRLIFGIPGAISLLSLFCIPLPYIGLKESPVWLLRRGYEEKARRTVKQLYFSDSSDFGTGRLLDDHLDFIKKSLKPNSGDNSFRSSNSWYAFLTYHKRSILLSTGSYVIQQLSGINILVFFSGVIFATLGFDKRSALLASACSSLPQLLIIFLSSYYLDRLGRKTPFMISTLLMAFCYALLSTTQYITPIDSQKAFSVVTMFLAFVSFASGLGTVPHILSAELLPSEHRAKGMALCSTTNWFVNGIVSFSYMPLLMIDRKIRNEQNQNSPGFLVYILYAIINLISFLVILFVYPKRVEKHRYELLADDGDTDEFDTDTENA